MSTWMERPSLAEIDAARAVLLRKRRKRRRLLAALAVIVLVALCVGGCGLTVARPVRVTDAGMEPTLRLNALALTNTLDREATHGSLVLLRLADGTLLVRRVIGVAGDAVQLEPESGTVRVNGVALSEPYVSAETVGTLETDAGVLIPQGKLYVLGDERYGARDSRSSDLWLVDTSCVIGTVWATLWPPQAVN